MVGKLSVLLRMKGNSGNFRTENFSGVVLLLKTVFFAV